jgi:biopolymer transport protein ExbD
VRSHRSLIPLGVAAVMLAATALASAEPTSKTVTIRGDGSLLVDGKASTSPELEKSFADAETEGHPPNVRVRIQFEENAKLPVLKTIANVCTAHKVRIDAFDVVAGDKPSRDGAAIPIELRFDEKEKRTFVTIDGKDAGEIAGGPVRTSSIGEIVTELKASAEKRTAAKVEVSVVGGPGKGVLASFLDAVVEAKLRSASFTYKDA